jgi:type IV pilus assembly protein PilO
MSSLEEKFQELQDQVQNFDPAELSVDNIGTWPLPVKVICWLVVFVGIVVGGYKFIVSDLYSKKSVIVVEEETLKKEFENKAFQAANLDSYRKQMIEMEESFGALISQLPSDTEVPGLLEDISNKGASAGLTFSSIDLQKELRKEYYIELPIKISAVGTYHDMGAFVSGVASLPRIVTLTNFSIVPKGKGETRNNSNLELQIIASTYRYNSSGETDDKGKKGRKKKGGKR